MFYLHAYAALKNENFKKKTELNDLEQDAFKYFMDYYGQYPSNKEDLKALVCAYFVSPETGFQDDCINTVLAAIRNKCIKKIKSFVFFAGIASLTYYLTTLL